MSSKKETQRAKMNTKKGKKKSRGFLLPFFLTLTFVLAVGISVLFVLTKKDTAQNVLPKKAETGLSYEEIPLQEESIGKENAVEEETAVEENAEAEENIVEEDLGRYGELLKDEDYLAENYIFEKEAAKEDEITITFAGDILFDPNYSMMNAYKNGGGVLSKCISEEVLSIMRASDIMMVNNEFPYSDRGTPTEEKQFTFRANKDSVSLLQEMGVDIVSLANNHAYDYGENALIDSCEVLEGADIPYVGAGRNKAQAQRTAYFIINDTKIAILSATQIERLDTPDTKAATENSAGVFRCWNNAELLEQIRIAKENSDFVIVYIHWGTENEETTDWAQDKQAPEMAQAGADIVIGDHPHCLQKVEVTGGIPVVYSLGNFWFNSKTLDTAMVQITVAEDKLKSLQFIPCLQSGCRTSLMHDGEKQRVLDYMNSLSGNLRFNSEGFAEY